MKTATLKKRALNQKYKGLYFGKIWAIEFVLIERDIYHCDTDHYVLIKATVLVERIGR